ncbi:uncharacterized protein CTHT_0032470 [Thermochaetoides thermophila DSM 1495]|uniref:Lysophospholipase n=1 Tax=Chaetomium thermophilum (strain DSM 1495 / CBS 144.50 / IMI 039719) TaxID=759272 RepID=G0S571_CHATD|nr:hypothetical protein CTHT_0032470 [Thermochaetoides thermophila DSM 1495]EGS21390.1 hypothetical protein CTHT_0032470 [Thermochaetoides thermophila DSM 1495]
MLFAFWLYPSDSHHHCHSLAHLNDGRHHTSSFHDRPSREYSPKEDEENETAWSRFVHSISNTTFIPSADALSDKVIDMLMPEWTKLIPGYIRKLQRELSLAPGSLAAEIWREAQDPYVHPEIRYAAKVRVSNDLCDEEKEFLARRKRMIVPALAKYLGVDEGDICPDDVPTIAMCGSGGGLRALVAGTGYFSAASEDGLFDCATYVSGVSGSCWLQSLYYSSVTGGSFLKAIDHLKTRLGTHIAYPPVAFNALTSSPTNKYLLSGLIEKLKGDPGAQVGLVDLYGMLLAARLLVPKGELGVHEKDFKLSNQHIYIKYGQNPLPIYTAVRHEIPESSSEVEEETKAQAQAQAKKDAWFQWFEMTPYEFFCEEFSAGIPTWALGRKFNNGSDVPSPTAEGSTRLPEIRLPLLLGIWGSAFCATLSHYYREIRPLVKNLTGFAALDDLIWAYDKDMSVVHPIEPAAIPNPVYGMHGRLPQSVPKGVLDNEFIQLMDAGMSNNLPIYPLLRPGRNVDLIIAFDSSADIKTDNWLSIVEGYAKQRGIKGWPVGIGWPKEDESPSRTAAELSQAERAAETTPSPQPPASQAPIEPSRNIPFEQSVQQKASKTLGYCTIWVGTTLTSSTPTPATPISPTTISHLLHPHAGIAVAYFPLLANEKVAPGVDVATSEFMSTWNFVYTPEQVEQVVRLARGNFAEGRDQLKRVVRAIYERKRKARLEREQAERERRLVWGFGEFV